MATVPLSARLQALVGAVVEGAPVWDIGCDHGLVGWTALHDGRASEAILVDKSARVTAALGAKIVQHVEPGLRARVRVLTGDAARLPAEPVEGTVVIAGMGARAMVRILSAFVLPNASSGLRLVLQPEVEPDRLRGWLIEQGLHATTDRVIEERGQRHVLLLVDHVPGRA